ncbi:DUF4861 family protein [Sphingobacterium thalpophilum]|uniref:DUF4861 family protein n=1 Tax=Sphingobacterium TaxID=28453 RepID=UPI002243BF49|nr:MULTISPECIES: DUF4861 family protein [Sphingobacterium]MCW8311008.1 DUF4861 domain-containing protein [Sphingobacterium sp. InxBP1]
MKKTFVLSLALGLWGIALAQNNKTITVSNPSSFTRTELISIPYATFERHFALKENSFSIVDSENKKELAYQLEKLGQQTAQNVLVQVSLAPKSSLTFAVTGNAPTAVSSKTYARYVPERKDDFAWENDIAAFRAYGKALEGSSEDAQGFDFWAKRTNDLIIDEWYKTGDYHADHGKGLDYYSVGQTLGVGDATPFIDGQVVYHKHYRQYKVLDNGPLRSTFKLIYEPENVKDQNLQVEKTVSLDAGSQLNRISYAIKNSTASSTSVAIGLAKRKEEKPQFLNDAKSGILAYWEPAEGDKITGTAVIVPKASYVFKDSPTQFLLTTTVENNNPLVYFAGAAFNKAGKINNFEQWQSYLRQFRDHLNQPLIIKYSK